MRSSTGEHYIALDHVRALAAFMVFAWHFIHGPNGHPVPFGYAPAVFPLALLDEGHTGVSLFMTLSGYLFAKLLAGKRVDYRAFFFNRFVRLVPLLSVVIVVLGIQTYFVGENLSEYVWQVVSGVIRPTLPGGGWSITVEFHFYIMLPFLLMGARRTKLLLPAIVVVGLLLRTALYFTLGEVQNLAYWTIVGRSDQFLAGILAFEYRDTIVRHLKLVIISAIAFALFYWWFDLNGGYWLSPFYPSPSPVWIFLPTLEGLMYSIAIASYDGLRRPSESGISKSIGRLGDYSYSIYMLHFFFVFALADFIDSRIMDLSNFYVALVWSIACFVLIAPVGYLGFTAIEAPFVRLRKRYVIDDPTQGPFTSSK